jgi:hypothetical protein
VYSFDIKRRRGVKDRARVINKAGFIRKLRNILTHDFDYVFMKLFARIYFFKSIFLFFRHLTSTDNSHKADDPMRSAVELLDGATVSEIVSDLNQNGCCSKIRLSNECLSNILNFADKTRCYAYGDPKKGFYLSEKEACQKALKKDILLAKYFNFQNDEAFGEFINSPLLERIAIKYLGSSAKNIATQLWWTFPAEVDDMTRSEAAHFFHRDVDAWGFVKFFFYLTDVDRGYGPHVYVKRSHKPSLIAQFFKEKFLINRHPDSSVRKRFGDDAVLPIYGPPGTGIAADTFGLHKGESPTKKPRLMMCAVYATKDFGEQEFEVDKKYLASYTESIS